MSRERTEKELLLYRIAQFLILNTCSCTSPGIYHGKMGIALFFCHYGRHISNTFYQDFAGELIDEIYSEIHSNTPIDFENGLCGIAWGIEYLVQKKFMDGDTSDILKDIDSRIMERDPRRIKDYSFESGLLGIAYYATEHIKSPYAGSPVFDQLYMDELKDAIAQAKSGEGSMSFPPFIFSKSLAKFNINQDGLEKWPLGLHNGLAGIGLKAMGI